MFTKIPVPNFLRHEIFKRVCANQNIAVISYPKSGRSWLRVMLNECGWRGNFFHAGSEYALKTDYQNVDAEMDKFYNSKIIFLCRDPRDLTVSYYFQAVHRKEIFQGGIDDFIRSSEFGIRKACAFNVAWLSSFNQFKGFFVLKYENMKRDPFLELNYLLNFIGLNSMSDRQIKKVVEDCKFENMKKRERDGLLSELYPGIFGKVNNSNESYKVRKGNVGGYTEYLSQNDIDYCNCIMADYGYNPDKLNVIENLSVHI